MPLVEGAAFETAAGLYKGAKSAGKTNRIPLPENVLTARFNDKIGGKAKRPLFHKPGKISVDKGLLADKRAGLDIKA